MTTQVSYSPVLFENQLSGLTTAQRSRCSFAHLLSAQYGSQTSVSSRDVYPIAGLVHESEDCGYFIIGCKDGELTRNAFTVDNHSVSFPGHFASNEAECKQMMADVKSGTLDFFVKEGGVVGHAFTAYFMSNGKLYCRGFDATSHGFKNLNAKTFTEVEAFIRHSQTYADKNAVLVC